jgi:hypothetical protein
MPLQNRVDPFGEIHARTERGLFTGNRGVIHDPETRTLLKRRWTTKAWLICACDFPGRGREVMGRNAPSGRAGWTELFFLDEVTALSAGHRPCLYCRRPAAADFLGRFGDAFGLAEPRAREIDARLHVERRASRGKPLPLEVDAVAALPDGAMLSDGAICYAVRDGHLLPWSFGGYRKLLAEPPSAALHLLTPPTTAAVLRAGYRPVWHDSARQ